MVSERAGPPDGFLSPAAFSRSGEELETDVRGGVESVASLVASTYGPQGMDKLIQFPGRAGRVEIAVTNSGSQVLSAIERGDGFNHPVAALLVDAVDTMHRDLHDGSTTAVLLTDSLVARGYDLVADGLAPSDVVVGYALAAERAGSVLDGLARPVDHGDADTLRAIARTAMGHRPGDVQRDRAVDLVVDAVTGLADATDGAWLDTERVKVLADAAATTALHEGVVVTRWPRGAETSERSFVDFDWEPMFPGARTDLTVAILDAEIDVEKTATNFGAGGKPGVVLEDAGALETYRAGYESATRRVAAGIADLGVDVLISEPGVPGDLETHLADAGISVLDRVQTPESDIDRLAVATGATVVSRPADLTPAHLGTAGRVSEARVGAEKWTFVTDCDGGAYTVVLRARTEQDAAYQERLVETALDVLATAIVDDQVLPGAGAPQLTVAADLRDYANGIRGAEQLATLAFADALEDTVRTLVRNAGLDPIDELTALRTARATGDVGDALGVDVLAGEQVEAWEAGIVEPRRVLSQAMETARSMATELLLTDAFLHPNVSLADFTPTTEHD